jgi:hypothetical protein
MPARNSARKLRVPALGWHRLDPDGADREEREQERGGVDQQRPAQPDREQQRRGERRPDDRRDRVGRLADPAGPGAVRALRHHRADHREPGRVEELPGRGRTRHHRVREDHQGQVGQRAGGQERHRGQPADEPGPDQVGDEHRAPPVPPVDEHPGDRGDRHRHHRHHDQQPGHRGGSERPAAQQDHADPEGQRGVEDEVTDDRHRLPGPQPNEVAVTPQHPRSVLARPPRRHPTPRRDRQSDRPPVAGRSRRSDRPTETVRRTRSPLPQAFRPPPAAGIGAARVPGSVRRRPVQPGSALRQELR